MRPRTSSTSEITSAPFPRNINNVTRLVERGHRGHLVWCTKIGRKRQPCVPKALGGAWEVWMFRKKKQERSWICANSSNSYIEDSKAAWGSSHILRRSDLLLLVMYPKLNASLYPCLVLQCSPLYPTHVTLYAAPAQLVNCIAPVLIRDTNYAMP